MPQGVWPLPCCNQALFVDGLLLRLLLRLLLLRRLELQYQSCAATRG